MQPKFRFGMFQKCILISLFALPFLYPDSVCALNRKVKETPIVQVTFSALIRESFTVSPDSRSIAFIDQSKDKQRAVIGSAVQRKFDEVIDRPVFSPNSRKVAYIAREQDKKFAVIEGEKGKQYEDIPSNIIFSPDSNRVAYTAKVGKKEVVVVDGRESEQYDEICRLKREANFVFSPDSKRIGYIAHEGKRDSVVVDGKHCGEYGGEYDGIDLLTFSPDSQSIAYRAYTYAKFGLGGKWFLVFNGKEGKEYKIIGDSFSTYRNIVFSPDSKRGVVKARFGIAEIGMEDTPYEKTGYPVFSPDSQTLSYMAGFSDKQFLVINGKKGETYDSLGSKFYFGNPVFSPDSKRIAYPVRKGKKWSIVIDAIEGQFYDEILVFPGGERVFESLDNYPVYDFIARKLESELAIRGRLVFDNPDRIHYLALKGNTIYLVEETFE